LEEEITGAEGFGGAEGDIEDTRGAEEGADGARGGKGAA